MKVFKLILQQALVLLLATTALNLQAGDEFKFINNETNAETKVKTETVRDGDRHNLVVNSETTLPDGSRLERDPHTIQLDSDGTRGELNIQGTATDDTTAGGQSDQIIEFSVMNNDLLRRQSETGQPEPGLVLLPFGEYDDGDVRSKGLLSDMTVTRGETENAFIAEGYLNLDPGEGQNGPVTVHIKIDVAYNPDNNQLERFEFECTGKDNNTAVNVSGSLIRDRQDASSNQNVGADTQNEQSGPGSEDEKQTQENQEVTGSEDEKPDDQQAAADSGSDPSDHAKVSHDDISAPSKSEPADDEGIRPEDSELVTGAGETPPEPADEEGVRSEDSELVTGAGETPPEPADEEGVRSEDSELVTGAGETPPEPADEEGVRSEDSELVTGAGETPSEPAEEGDAKPEDSEPVTDTGETPSEPAEEGDAKPEDSEPVTGADETPSEPADEGDSLQIRVPATDQSLVANLPDSSPGDEFEGRIGGARTLVTGSVGLGGVGAGGEGEDSTEKNSPENQ
ncbi:hypothetical protein [Endozoicomonas lisbonensis]|uniref:Uncharacterized protein n=1 Tax=Endozoicomonas lisbonensis TaxID=3120522 RepID=A0ABV2SFX4_9GAMM